MEAGTENRVTVTVVPVQKMTSNLFKEVMALIEKAVENSEGLHTLETVAQWIEDESLQVWVAIDDDGLQGCFLTEVIPVAKGLDLNVPYVGFKKNFKALNDSMKELLRVARKSGYRSLRFISSDERVGSFAKRHGMRRRFIEYVGEF